MRVDVQSEGPARGSLRFRAVLWRHTLWHASQTVGACVQTGRSHRRDGALHIPWLVCMSACVSIDPEFEALKVGWLRGASDRALVLQYCER